MRMRCSGSGIDQRVVEYLMSSENLHAPRERLAKETLNLHFGIVSLMVSCNGKLRGAMRSKLLNADPPVTGLALIAVDMA